MHINSIIVILDLLEKILGKGANHEKIKKHILATDNQSPSIKIKKYINRFSSVL